MKHLSLCALILFLIANIFFGYEPKTPYQILNEKGLESMYKLDQLLGDNMVLPRNIKSLKLIVNATQETIELSQYQKQNCEWLDGTATIDWKPSEHNSGFPYYLIQDTDNDLTWRSVEDMKEITE